MPLNFSKCFKKNPNLSARKYVSIWYHPFIQNNKENSLQKVIFQVINIKGMEGIYELSLGTECYLNSHISLNDPKISKSLQNDFLYLCVPSNRPTPGRYFSSQRVLLFINIKEIERI